MRSEWIGKGGYPMSALIGARLTERVRREAERLQKEADLNPVAEQVGKYGAYFKDGQKYVYSLGQLDFVLSEIEYHLTHADEVDEDIKKDEEERKKYYTVEWKEQREKEYIETDGASGMVPDSTSVRVMEQERAGHFSYYLRGYIAAFSEEVKFDSEEEENKFFRALSNWSASYSSYSQARNIWRKKSKETVHRVLLEYANSQVIDSLSEKEAKKYIELRVSEEMKAFENTINWLRAYLHEARRK
jgi:hypothetical protein